MTTQKMMILRSSVPDLGSALAATPSTGPFGELVSDVSLTVESLSADDIADARHDPRVRAMAPPMSARLIDPVPADEATESGDHTWGVEAVGAVRCPYDGEGVVVAVLDTGIDRDHSCFEGLNIIARDFRPGAAGSADHAAHDDHGHGTHVAGTIFGRPVAGVRIGVAPGVSTAMIGKVLDHSGSGGTPAIAEGLVWAVHAGADIVCMSLGLDFPGYVEHLIQRGYPATLATSVALEAYRTNVRLFDTLAQSLRAWAMLENGCGLVVAAAGNGSRRDLHKEWRITASPPAEADGFVAVSAVGRRGSASGEHTVAPFSNTGANICAPGVGVRSAKAGTVNGLVAWDGTSMAAPHVAGIAALWAQKLFVDAPPPAHDRLVARLLGSARPIGGLHTSDVGLGIATAPQE